MTYTEKSSLEKDIYVYIHTYMNYLFLKKYNINCHDFCIVSIKNIKGSTYTITNIKY